MLSAVGLIRVSAFHVMLMVAKWDFPVGSGRSPFSQGGVELGKLSIGVLDSTVPSTYLIKIVTCKAIIFF